MMRVLRPGGRLAVAVCDAVEQLAGLRRLRRRCWTGCSADASATRFARRSCSAIPSSCSPSRAKPGSGRRASRGTTGTVRFESIASLVSTERACVVDAWRGARRRQFARLLEEPSRAQAVRRRRRNRGVRHAGADHHGAKTRCAGAMSLPGAPIAKATLRPTRAPDRPLCAVIAMPRSGRGDPDQRAVAGSLRSPRALAMTRRSLLTFPRQRAPGSRVPARRRTPRRSPRRRSG